LLYSNPEFGPPYRVVVLMASLPGWYEAGKEEREAQLDAFSELLLRTERDGARLLASVDDDHFMTGQPASLPYSIYIVYDIDDLGVIASMVDRLRSSSMCKYFRMEARIGRKLFLLSN
jgi:hypothetical protein